MPPTRAPGTRPPVSLTMKISLAGDPGVGKTALVRRFVTDTFDEGYVSTLGTKISSKQFAVADPRQPGLVHEVGATIWDIMGTIGFREILKDAYFHNAKGALLVCDGTRPDSLVELLEWYNAVSSVAGDIPAVVLVNKSDLTEDPKVRPAYVEQLCAPNGWPWFATSAKTGENVEEAFRTVAERYLATLKVAPHA